MTVLDVTLSSGFTSEVSGAGNGMWVYAIAYDTYDTAGVITTLVADGSVQGAGNTVPVTLLNGADPTDTAFVSGKVYFVVQDSGATSSIASQVTLQAELNIHNAATDHFVYDSVEMNLTGVPGQSGFDVANLTSVAGFALPMEISAAGASVGYNVSASNLISQLQTNEGGVTTDTSYFLTGPLTADFPTALSPSAVISAATPNPTGVTFQSSNWASYVAAMAAQVQSAPTEIVLSGLVNGAKDVNGVFHNAGYFAYDVTYNPSATLNVNGTVETGVFMLVPTESSQILGVIAIDTADLQQSIYSTLGTAEIFGSTADVLSGAAPQYTIGTGANDQWGGVLRSFLVGFTAGYYGGEGKPLNPQLTASIDSIDLNNSINWDPTYAFGGIYHAGTSSETLVTRQSGYGTVSQIYDPYAQAFYANTNSYGSGYSDALMNAYEVGGPLLPVQTNGTDVPTIDLTIFGQSETPTGYTAPELYNYIAPPKGGYAIPSASSLGNDNIGLNFVATEPDGAGMILAGTEAVTLSIMTSDVGNTPTWTTVTLGGGTASPWQLWDLSYNTTTGTYAATSGGTKPAGNMLIDLPVAQSGTAWYQIGVAGKTFNLYTVMQNGSFENPNYAGANQKGALAVDGLAAIATNPSTVDATLNTFNVNFLTGAGGVGIAPSALTVDTGNFSGVGTPDAPVAGSLPGTTLEAFAGQTNQVTNTITIPDQGVAFGWTGTNNSTGSGTASWISGFTSKVGADDIVVVTAASAGSTLTATATANLDGEWQTGIMGLGVGTYDVTMQGFLPSATSFTNADAVTPVSSALTLDVVACFASGTRILTARGEIAVEELAVGDLVWSRGAGLTPVRWLGRRNLDCRRHARPRDAAPVRVLAGAFAPGVPHRDLLLSPDHAVFAEGVLIPVRYLVNGRTIRREAVGSVTYHHVELARHDVILAEGLACESYLDTGNRAIFENAPGEKADDAFALGVWETDSCAKLVLKGPELATVRRRLLARAAELGHATTQDPALRLVVDGRVLRPSSAGRVARFRLPPSARDVRLVSRNTIPAQTSAIEDHRLLGVAVARIRLDDKTISLDDPRLLAGWNGVERDAAGSAWRWTEGDARLALGGGRLLEVEIAMTEAYWHDATSPAA